MEGAGSIPGQRTKILKIAWHGQKNEKQTKKDLIGKESADYYFQLLLLGNRLLHLVTIINNAVFRIISSSLEKAMAPHSRTLA